MQTYTDEELVAYADDELPANQAQAISVAAQNDPALARRIAPFVESRRILQEVFSKQLREPIPQRLLDVLGGTGDTSAKVVPLRRPVLPSRGWVPMALAASLALAVGLTTGDWFGQRRADSGIELAGLPPDPAAVNLALETLASGSPLTGEAQSVRYEVMPLASLRTETGAWCREFESTVFEVSTTQRVRGLACRETGGRWQTEMLARLPVEVGTSPASGGYQTAAGDDVDLSATLGTARRLTPAEEQEQIQHRWKD